MISEQELKEFELARLKKQAEGKDENDPLNTIEELSLENKQQLSKFAEREKELLFKIAKQEKENRLEREAREKSDRSKEVAEWKYLNQQKTEIDGLSSLINKKKEETPAEASRRIFVERLKVRLERSQKAQEEKKDNVYYI